MRLISLVNTANFFEVMSLTRCEYSRYEARCPSICEVCPCISGVCPCISRGVYVSVPISYCKHVISMHFFAYISLVNYFVCMFYKKLIIFHHIIYCRNVVNLTSHLSN
jgi:hypothetical protein